MLVRNRQTSMFMTHRLRGTDLLKPHRSMACLPGQGTFLVLLLSICCFFLIFLSLSPCLSRGFLLVLLLPPLSSSLAILFSLSWSSFSPWYCHISLALLHSLHDRATPSRDKAWMGSLSDKGDQHWQRHHSGQLQSVAIDDRSADAGGQIGRKAWHEIEYRANPLKLSEKHSPTHMSFVATNKHIGQILRAFYWSKVCRQCLAFSCSMEGA